MKKSYGIKRNGTSAKERDRFSALFNSVACTKARHPEGGSMMTMESTKEAVKTATLYLVFYPSLHMPFNDHSCEEVKEELCK